ncbi:MAG: WD40 repeat domain-containing protein [Methylacidiphilales bacterium]|nr:WD40 repeat domain-containing protein [Candidatus Methylacidiphilales bacterium]NJR15687.1 WD40 repeat domain-containing protein [Calothrix sp. CSU_2_0]
MKNRCPNFTSQPIEYAVVDKKYNYNITTCKDNDRDRLKITYLEKPDWLQFKDNGNGTATLSGTPKFSHYGKVSLWNTSGKFLATFSQEGRIGNMGFSPDGKKLATVLSNSSEVFVSKPPYRIQISDISSQKLFKKFEYPARIKNIYFSPDGQYIVATLGDGTVRIRDVSGKQKLVTLRHKGEITSVSFSSDSQRIATASGDGTARLWNFKGIQQAILWHEGRVKAISFSPNEQYLATDSDDGKSSLWDIYAKKRLSTFPSHGYSRAIFFTNDGKHLVNTSDEHTVSIWDIFSGEQIVKYNHPKTVGSFILSPDGKYLISTEYDDKTTYNYKKIRLWEISGKLVNEVDLQKLETKQPTSIDYVALNPNGKRKIKQNQKAQLIHNFLPM